MTHWIGLVDCNNFFVSCERLFRPDLKGRPVLVLSSNDGCVISRSQEVKDIGVPMGVPAFHIKDIIKDKEITTFSSHFALYRDISSRVFKILAEEVRGMKQYSVDEAFFVIEGSKEDVEVTTRVIKDNIEQKVGIPVSIGVATSKTLAKYAATVAKRTEGVFVLTTEHWQEMQQDVKLEKIWGVGGKSAAHCRSHGIEMVSDFLTLDERQVSRLLGVYGVRLWYELKGVQAASNRTKPQQSILHSRSFKSTTNDKAVLADAVAYHVREAAKELREIGMSTTMLTVYLGTSRHGDFFLKGGSKEALFAIPTDDTFTILCEAQALLNQLYSPDIPYKKAGVLLSGFVESAHAPQSLFEDLQAVKTKNLSHEIDRLNQSLKGRAMLMPGMRFCEEKWQASAEKKSPSYTTNWTDLAIVKA
jgi:DNA polymerase V